MCILRIGKFSCPPRIVTKVKSVALVVTTYNRPDALNLVLDSVARQSVLPDEVVVGDDGSTESTREIVEQWISERKFPLTHAWQEDLGFRAAACRNLAIKKTKSEYIVLIDGDMLLEKHFIEDHVKFALNGFFTQGSRAKISDIGTSDILTTHKESPTFHAFDKRLKSKRYGLRSAVLSNIFSGERFFNRLSMLQTCNLAFFRSDFEHVNGFDEDYVGWGREDSDFCARLMHSGVRRRDLRFKAVAYHLHHEGESRNRLSVNDGLLKKTLSRKSIQCANGIRKIENENSSSNLN